MADGAHWISLAPKEESLFSPPGFNPDYSAGFQLHENLNLRNLLQFQINSFLKMQAKANQQFGTLASSAYLSSLWLLLLQEVSWHLALMWKGLCGPAWLWQCSGC